MLDKLIDRWWDLVTRHPGKVVLACLGITAFFGYFAFARFRMDNSIDKLMTSGDRDWEYLKVARQSFGSDDILTLAIHCEKDKRGVYRPDVLAMERALSDRMARLEMKVDGKPFDPTHTVSGLSDSNTIRGTELGMRVVDIMDVPPKDQGGAEIVRERALQDVILIDSNVNRAGTVASIDVFLKPEDSEKRVLFGQRVAERVEEAIAELETKYPAKVYANGESVFNLESTRYTTRDLTLRTGIVLLLVLTVLAIAFRSAAGVLLPVLTPLGATIWTIGFVHLTGNYLTVTTGIVPVLIIAIGTASTMHVVAHHGLEGGSTPAEYVKLAMRKVGGAVFLAGLTTALGFSSLLTNDIVNIREMGLYSAFGITADFVLSMSLVPALLTFQKRPVSRLNEDSGSPRLERLLLGLSRFAVRRRWPVVAAAVLAVGLSVWGTSYLRVESNYLELLKDDDPMRVADDFIEENLTGQKVFNVYLQADPEFLKRKHGTTDVKKPFFEPEILSAIEKVHDFLYPTVTCSCGERVAVNRVEPGESVGCPRCRGAVTAPVGRPRSTWSHRVKKVASFVDFVRQMNKASNFNDPGEYRVPDDRKTIATYVMNHGKPKDMVPYITYDRSFTRVFIRTDIAPSNDIAVFNDELQGFCDRTFKGLADARACSTLSCIAKAQNAISWGQLKSLGLTLLCISVILVIAFRSPKIGLLALPPNLLPVAVLFGLMGAMGTNLDIGTSIVGCMGIGIAVDDTVHFLSRYLKELGLDGDVVGAIERTTATTGRPIVFTSVALALGFTVLLSSDFVPVIYLGLYTAVTMVVALIGDLVLLPALLAIVRPRSGRVIGETPLPETEAAAEELAARTAR
jgi:predicted RND superfamily exporter protein